jgi:flagellin-like hook-associated protein FlgL
MSLVINNNMMAANTARNLSATYGKLGTSIERLSTGLWLTGPPMTPPVWPFAK